MRFEKNISVNQFINHVIQIRETNQDSSYQLDGSK